MKKAIFLINERHERVSIRYKRRRTTNQLSVCEDCGEQFEWLTVNEAAGLFGSDAEEIKLNLKTLRRKHK